MTIWQSIEPQIEQTLLAIFASEAVSDMAEQQVEQILRYSEGSPGITLRDARLNPFQSRGKALWSLKPCEVVAGKNRALEPTIRFRELLRQICACQTAPLLSATISPFLKENSRNADGYLSSVKMRNFIRDDGGQDLVEYSLLLAFLALATIGLLTNARTSLNGLWGTVSRSLNTANTAAAS